MAAVLWALTVPTASCADGGEPVGTPPPRVLSGELVVAIKHHTTGQTEEGILVWISRPGATTRNAATDALGRAAFPTVEVGDWSVRFQPPSGFVPWPGRPVPATVTVREGETTQHLFEYVTEAETVLRGSVRVTAVESTAEGPSLRVRGARIRLLQGRTVIAELETAAAPIDLLENVAVGNYTAEVEPPSGYALATGESGERAVSVTGTVTAFVDAFQLRMDTGLGGLAGFVTPVQSFSGVAGAHVDLVFADGTVLTAVTDPSGWYEHRGVTPGPYDLRLRPPTGWRIADGAQLPDTVGILRNLMRLISLPALEQQP